MLADIKQAVDMLAIDRLWSLACTDPGRFYNQFTVRHITKGRMEKLHAYLLGRDREKLGQQRHFEYLLLCKVEKELGTGLFKGVVSFGKRSAIQGKTQEG